MGNVKQTSGKIVTTYTPRMFTWVIPGVVAVGTEQGATYRTYRAIELEDVDMHVKTAPTGATLIIDINQGGASVFSTRPEIDISGTTEDDNHVFGTTTIAAGVEITLDVDQVGSTVAGSNLTVNLPYKESLISA